MKLVHRKSILDSLADKIHNYFWRKRGRKRETQGEMQMRGRESHKRHGKMSLKGEKRRESRMRKQDTGLNTQRNGANSRKSWPLRKRTNDD